MKLYVSVEAETPVSFSNRHSNMLAFDIPSSAMTIHSSDFDLSSSNRISAPYNSKRLFSTSLRLGTPSVRKVLRI